MPSWVALARFDVELVPCGEDRVILSGTALRGADVADTAVATIHVPTHEVGRTNPSLR